MAYLEAGISLLSGKLEPEYEVARNRLNAKMQELGVDPNAAFEIPSLNDPQFEEKLAQDLSR